MPKTNPLTEKQRKLLEMATIQSQMPVVFDNGFRLEVFEGSCCACQAPIASCDLHGSLTLPIPSVAVLEGIGICWSCNIAVPFLLRFRDNGTMEWVDDQGKWVRTTRQPKGLLALIRKSIAFAVLRRRLTK